METKTVIIPNISCGHCVKAIKNELESIDGVSGVSTDFPQTKNVTVSWDAPADWKIISETLEEIGYPADEK